MSEKNNKIAAWMSSLAFLIKNPLLGILLIIAACAFFIFLATPAFQVPLVLNWPLIRQHANNPDDRAFLILVFFLIGFTLAVVQNHFRKLYGSGEILSGFLALWASISPKEEDRFVATIAVAGGVYLVTSGFNHLFEANREAQDGFKDFGRKDGKAIYKRLSVIQRELLSTDRATRTIAFGHLLGARAGLTEIRDYFVRSKARGLINSACLNGDGPNAPLEELIQFLKDVYE
jgi:hypothetical protein